MNSRLISMIIFIVFFLSTGVSALTIYQASQNNQAEIVVELRKISDKMDLERKQISTQLDLQYQKELAAYNERKRQADLNHEIIFLVPPTRGINLSNPPSSREYTAIEEKLWMEENKLRTTLIIHAIFAGFLIIAEIGMLITLPKGRNITHS